MALSFRQCLRHEDAQSHGEAYKIADPSSAVIGRMDARVTRADVQPAREEAARLLRRGLRLEYATLGWNVVGIVVLAVAAAMARSVALAGFGLDSLIEIGASIVVVWELSGSGADRQRRALRIIGFAFMGLAAYLALQSTALLLAGYHPRHSRVGIVWTGLTAVVMLELAAGKARTGRALGNPVLLTESRVTVVDAILAVAVLAGLVLNSMLGWWWADPAAAYVLVFYAVKEGRTAVAASSAGEIITTRTSTR